MSKRTVVLNNFNIIYLLSIFILVNAIPIDNDKDDKTDIPPLIEFKNGGIRINFAGYHAEAGLGGMLTGSKTGGGLHASAGTPSGAHASAGLGGLLEDGSIGGGLHARAGLGNGGLGVRAGLGGVLGGSEKSGSKTTGVLYADSNLKDFINIPKLEKAQKHKHSKNIQVIPPPSKKSEDDNQSTVKGPLDGLKSLVSSEKVEFHPADPLALKYAFDKVVLVDDTNENKEKPIDKLTKIKAEKAELKKNSDESDSESSSTSDEENKELKDNAIIKQSAPVDDKDPRPARKYFKKRLQERTEPAQRYIDEANEKLNTERYRRSKTGLFVRSAASAEASEGEPNTNGNGRKFRGQTLFDDIFNIPISALNAVNKLLNNIHKKE